MFKVRDYSISKKLTWMNMLVSSAALLLACAGLVAYDVVTFRAAMVRSLSIQAQIIGSNSVSALLFNDSHSAENTLSALKAAPNILSAAIYTPEGQPFVGYWRNHQGPFALPPQIPRDQTEAHWFKERQLVLVRRIALEGKPVGSVLIQSDTSELVNRLQRYVAIVAVVLSVCLVVALLISSRFRTAIAAPIAHLAETASIISTGKNYAVRADNPGGRDEVATLVAAFNEMLSQIQQRDSALREAHEHLEHRIVERTAELTHANEQLRKEIAERQQAEEALRQSEERFRLLVSGVKDYAIIMLDPAGHVVSWNAGAERIKGYRAEEIIGQHFSRFYPAEDVERGKPSYELKAALQQGRIEDEGWRVRQDGTRFWANVVMTTLRDEAGRLRGYGKVTRDMTERKLAEGALQASEERFRNLAEAASDPIILADSHGCIVYFNRAAEKVFGYSASEANGQPLTLLMPERYRGPHRQGLDRFLRTREARVIGKTVELAGRRKDGAEFPLAVSLSSWKTREGVFFTGILSDITERKAAENALERHRNDLARSNAELAAANKELEAFSYSVSHDLRAPLRSIDGFSLALLEDYAEKLDAEGRDCLQRVRSATQRMGVLIDDLLKLAQVTRTEIRVERVNLSAVGRSVADELQRTQPERRTEFRIEDRLEAIADSHMIRIALENLLGNAWKFTSKRESACIEFGKTHRNGTQAYFVRDDGAGFDPAYVDRLFGAFQRLHDNKDFPGTGVGLATVQRIIHRHGGQIWAEGAVQKGATFYFTLSENRN